MIDYERGQFIICFFKINIQDLMHNITQHYHWLKIDYFNLLQSLLLVKETEIIKGGLHI